jgi:hypothetical protein
MKKCVYCETKKMKARSKSPAKLFGQCDYCTNRNKLAEERNAKILQAKRAGLFTIYDQLEMS